MRLTTTVCSATVFVTLAGGVLAQTSPSFEAASIRRNNSADESGSTHISPQGVFTAKNATLKGIFQEAYRVPADRISGGPKWFDTDRYDIAARPGRSVSQEQAVEMLKSLLAARFQLVVRRETREVNGFALVVANGGSRMKLNTDSVCEEPCGGTISSPSGKLSSRKVPISRFVNRLAEILNRPVLNSTGLTGFYDIELEWAPEAGQFQGAGREVADDGRPSIFRAVQEQLGLRLESRQVPLEVFVIESAQRPSEN